MSPHRLLSHLISLAILAFIAATGCRGASDALAGKASLTLSSPSITNGQVNRSVTCDGSNTSPALSWSEPPSATRSFALLVTDPDAPGQTFTHWVLFNIPGSARSLSSGISGQLQLPDGSRQGHNDFNATGYGGPCPPGHSPHRYIFNLYALDNTLDLPSGVTRSQVEDAMKGHVLARGQLIGRYSR